MCSRSMHAAGRDALTMTDKVAERVSEEAVMMRSARRVRFPAVVLLLLLALPLAAYAMGGTHQVFRASTTMESGVDRCAAKLEGKAFIACVAAELNKYSQRLSIKGAEVVAPQGAPNAAAAATGVGAAPNPAAAASVLNRVAAVVRTLAASSEKDARRSYTRIDQAFMRAASIVSGKS